MGGGSSYSLFPIMEKPALWCGAHLTAYLLTPDPQLQLWLLHDHFLPYKSRFSYIIKSGWINSWTYTFLWGTEDISSFNHTQHWPYLWHWFYWKHAECICWSNNCLLSLLVTLKNHLVVLITQVCLMRNIFSKWHLIKLRMYLLWKCYFLHVCTAWSQ